jgi:hypothetical protein
MANGCIIIIFLDFLNQASECLIRLTPGRSRKFALLFLQQNMKFVCEVDGEDFCSPLCGCAIEGRRAQRPFLHTMMMIEDRKQTMKFRGKAGAK